MSGAGIPVGMRVTYNQQYRRCGKAACARCAAGGPGHGPYWYAFWWEGGRRRSRYLGKHLPVGADTPAGEAPAAVAPAPPIEPLQVRTLGGFAVWLGDTLIQPERWTSRRASALFKCLLSVPGHRLQREQVIELLWPEAEPDAGAANLRTTIHLLRQIVDGPQDVMSHLRTEGAVLALAPAGDAVPADDWLDATTFAHAAQAALAGQDAATYQVALAGYGGDYLPDDLYAPWAEQPRTSLRRQYLDLLLHLATLSAAQGELEEAEACLRRVLAAEPSNEGAAATLMGLLAASDRRSAALQIYQQLATVLEEELEVVPCAEIAALRARLLAQEAAPLAGSVPLRQGQTVPLSNLPVALSRFVGRAWEVRAVAEALEVSRLVTLTGPGGCGKTRLALEAATRLVDAYPQGVWLVELAGLADPAGVPRAVAGALGVVEQPDRPIRETLGNVLRLRHLLLVLDNCEHLVDACAALAADLLRTCPHLRLLATSRERLEVAGERTYLVPSLAVPDPDHQPPLEQLHSYEAVQLFMERAQERRPELRLTTANAGAVAQICARLDGLPLALELAAGRVSVLSLDGIAARLDDRFRLLTGGPRTALPRQQTLRATLEWSYALLSAPEPVLLRRLAVFVGGCTLEAAEAACADGASASGVGSRESTAPPDAVLPGPDALLPADTVLDWLSRLVHKSLVQLEVPGSGTEGTARYRLLETVRQYGLEQLAAARELAEVRDRHLAWCVALAERATPHLLGSEQLDWLERLEREHENLRAALKWGTAQPAHAAAAVQLAGALWRFWTLHGYPHEGRHWLEATLARSAAAPPTLRARALAGAAELADLQGDLPHARAYGDEALALYRVLGQTADIARSLTRLGWVAFNDEREQALGAESLALARQSGDPLAIAGALTFLGCMAIPHDLAQAQALLEESLALGRGVGDRASLAKTLANLGQVALERGAYERAAALYAECLGLQRELQHLLGSAQVLNLAAEAAFCLGDTARATALLDESVRLCRDLGNTEHLAEALQLWGWLAWSQGAYARATALLEEALSIARHVGDQASTAAVLTAMGHVALTQGDPAQAVRLHRESLARRRGPPLGRVASLEGLAMALGVQGQATQAAWLLGAAERARDALDMPLKPYVRPVYERFVAAIRRTVSEDAFAMAWTAGGATPLETAIAQALRGKVGTQAL